MANFRVVIEPTRKGSFRVRSVDKHGKRQSHYCIEKNEGATINGAVLKGRSLAKAYAKIVEERYHKNELGDVDLGVEVEPLIEEFIQARINDNFQPTTVIKYQTDLGGFMEDMQPRRLFDINRDFILDWKKFMIAKPYETNTIISRLSNLRTFLNWLKDNDKIKVSPFGKKLMPMKKDAEPKYYTTEEFVRLDQAISGISHPARILFHLAHNLGLRKSEARGVCWEDILWSDQGAELLIRKEVAKGKKRSRVIPMDQGTLNILGSRRSGKLVVLKYPQQIDYLFDCAREKSGINQELDIHGLRHTFAKNYLQRGQGNLASLQKLMGHATIISTMIYAQFEKSYLREGIDRAYERRVQEEGLVIRQMEAQ